MKKKKFPAKLGFSAEFELIKPPTVVKEIFEINSQSVSAKPRAFRLSDLHTKYLPQTLLCSKDGSVAINALILNWGHKSERMRNCDGNEVWFVWRGAGACYTDFGMFWFKSGDYIFIPKSVLYRIEMLSPGLNAMVGIESALPFRRPDFGGLINRDIPYSPEKIIKPNLFSGESQDSADREGEWDVYIKRLGVFGTKATYSYSPFLTESWGGDIYPFLLHISDVNALECSGTHIDPTAFTTFITENKSVAVSTFKPRHVHSLPYNHMNYHDEFLFYASGYSARGKIIGEGDATFHPQGVWHGPQIEALVKEMERRNPDPKNPEWTDELAIMFESRKPLIVCDAAFSVESRDYYKSWHEGWEKYKESF